MSPEPRGFGYSIEGGANRAFTLLSLSREHLWHVQFLHNTSGEIVVSEGTLAGSRRTYVAEGRQCAPCKELRGLSNRQNWQGRLDATPHHYDNKALVHHHKLYHNG